MPPKFKVENNVPNPFYVIGMFISHADPLDILLRQHGSLGERGLRVVACVFGSGVYFANAGINNNHNHNHNHNHTNTNNNTNNNQQPATSNQQPTTDNRQPTTNNNNQPLLLLHYGILLSIVVNVNAQ